MMRGERSTGVPPEGSQGQRQVTGGEPLLSAVPADGVVPTRNPARPSSLGRQEIGMQQPQAGVYRGITPAEKGWEHSFSRGFRDFDIHMQGLFPARVSLDTFLDTQVDQAKQTGKDVIVVDLGAGHGNFARDALKQPDSAPHTKRKLGRKGRTKLRFISQTDADTPDQHLQQRPFPEADLPGNERIQATEVRYSVTSTQTIKAMMEDLDADHANLVTASNFMSYLTPQVFESVTVDVIDLLPPGGEFQVFGYATFSGSHLSVDGSHAEADTPVVFRDPYNLGEGDFTANDIRELGKSMLDDRNVSDNEINSFLAFIYDSYFASVNSPDQVQRALLNRLITHLQQSSSREVLASTLEELSIAEDTIRVADVKKEKDAILDRLQEQYDGKITIKRNAYDLVTVVGGETVWEKVDGFIIKKL